MANVVVFMVPELEVSEDHVKDGLRSLLHTILFSRSLGPIETSVKTCDFFAVSYCTTNNPEEKQLVDSSIAVSKRASHVPATSWSRIALLWNFLKP